MAQTEVFLETGVKRPSLLSVFIQLYFMFLHVATQGIFGFNV